MGRGVFPWGEICKQEKGKTRRKSNVRNSICQWNKLVEEERRRGGGEACHSNFWESFFFSSSSPGLILDFLCLKTWLSETGGKGEVSWPSREKCTRYKENPLSVSAQFGWSSTTTDKRKRRNKPDVC